MPDSDEPMIKLELEDGDGDPEYEFLSIEDIIKYAEESMPDFLDQANKHKNDPTSDVHKILLEAIKKLWKLRANDPLCAVVALSLRGIGAAHSSGIDGLVAFSIRKLVNGMEGFRDATKSDPDSN
jgi:hypothetical protein